MVPVIPPSPDAPLWQRVARELGIGGAILAVGALLQKLGAFGWLLSLLKPKRKRRR